MSSAFIQPMFLLIELFAVIQLVRFWAAIQSTGYFSVVIGRYHTAFMADCMAVFLFTVQLIIALNEWFGMPLDAIGIANKPAAITTWAVFGSFFALVWVNCRGRLEHDSATRTIVVLNTLNQHSSRFFP